MQLLIQDICFLGQKNTLVTSEVLIDCLDQTIYKGHSSGEIKFRGKERLSIRAMFCEIYWHLEFLRLESPKMVPKKEELSKSRLCELDFVETKSDIRVMQGL